MQPRVVWVAQAPLLLNRLCLSRSWNMQVASLPDANGLAELAQMDAPKWDGNSKGVVAAFACAPDHVQWVKEHLPDAKLVLVAHQGYAQKLPPAPPITPVVAFSSRCAFFVSSQIVQQVSVLTPAYAPCPCWSWSPDKVWTMMSRPKTRENISFAALEDARRIAHTEIGVYGQDQPDGFLTPQAKTYRLSSCSAYFEALPPRAGFGLAEHEAMAAGCPVVGAAWGDICTRLSCQKAFADYSNIYGLAALADRAAKDKEWAEARSAEQLQYIRDCFSQERMDESVERAMANITAG
jgi:hypothetical protein